MSDPMGLKQWVRHFSHSASKQSSFWLLEKGETASKREREPEEFELAFSGDEGSKDQPGCPRDMNLACEVDDGH